MNLLIDKSIIFILNIFAMEDILHGKFAVLFFYLFAIFELLLVWLLYEPEETRWDGQRTREIKKKLAIAAELILVCFMIIAPEYTVLLPLCAYDVSASKNRIGYVTLPITFLACVTSGAVAGKTLVYVFVLSVAAVLLCVRSKGVVVLKKRLHRLRDDDALTKSELKEKQTMLAKSMEQEVYAAQLTERNRIARDIHDNVGHMLSRAILMTGAMLTVHGKEPVGEELQSLRETLDSAMNSIRASVHDLKDESVDLELALRHLIEPLEKEYRVRTELDFRPVKDNEIKFAIIGIVKECVSNIIRHSENRFVDIKVVEHPLMYQIVVHDYSEETGRQGAGGKCGVPDTGGMGLSNIRARAEALGGSALITNEAGFRVFVTLPNR